MMRSGHDDIIYRGIIVCVQKIVATEDLTVISKDNLSSFYSSVHRSTKNLVYPVLLFYIQQISLYSLYSLTLTFLCAIYHSPLPLLRVRV